MRTYFWDFFGPAAERTAAHFSEHLVEFFQSHPGEDCELGTASAGAGHRAAYCIAPPSRFELIEGSLRPKRQVPGRHTDAAAGAG